MMWVFSSLLVVAVEEAVLELDSVEALELELEEAQPKRPRTSAKAQAITTAILA